MCPLIYGLLNDMDGVKWEIVHIAESETGPVLTERVDAFNIGECPVSVPVMGVFEFRGHLIARWSGYFDRGQYRARLVGDSTS